MRTLELNLRIHVYLECAIECNSTLLKLLERQINRSSSWSSFIRKWFQYRISFGSSLLTCFGSSLLGTEVLKRFLPNLAFTLKFYVLFFFFLLLP